MKIGIVVHSLTGNTLSVAEKLRDRLAASGHAATIERLMPVLANPKDPMSFRYDTLPDLSGYDALVLAAHVQGFSLCRAMVIYLKHLPALDGKKAACFVTKHLASAWTGGNKALAQMKRAVIKKGGVVCGTGMVMWASKQREKDIEEMVEKMGCLFG
jgi:NAD(P)H dehydrogenase (quinone)